MKNCECKEVLTISVTCDICGRKEKWLETKTIKDGVTIHSEKEDHLSFETYDRVFTDEPDVIQEINICNDCLKKIKQRREIEGV